MRPCHSETGPAGVRLLAIALFGILTFAAPHLIEITATVVTTDIFIVGEEQPIDEDVYVAASSGRIEGRIDGDLVITTGDLTISGTVTGSVTALSTAPGAPDGRRGRRGIRACPVGTGDRGG